jgi:cytochrome b561
VAIAIHWVTAIALVGLLISGTQAAGNPDPVAKAAVLRVHAVVGAAVLVLTLVRIGWWWLVDRKPDEPAGTPRWQAAAARLVHRLLYVVIIVMGASGIAMVALSGAGEVLFGSSPRPLPDFTAYPPRAPHGAGATALMVLAALHAGAALYHQFVLRDRLLARMGIGR